MEVKLMCALNRGLGQPFGRAIASC